jgi:drug/metabolite transporter (DMT)-like permease
LLFSNPNRMKRNGLSLSTAGGLAALAMWSTTMAMARSLAEQLGPLRAASAVYAVATVLCFLRLGLSQAPLSRFQSLPQKYLLGCGLLFVAYALLIYLAVGLAADRQQLLEVGLVNYLWPAFTILLSLILLGRRGGAALFPATALALAGIVLVMTQGAPVSWHSFLTHFQTNPMAYLLALAAATVWALYSNLARRWSAPDSHGAVDLFIPVTGAVLLVVVCLCPQRGSWTPRSLAEAGLLGVITALAYSLWDAAMRRGDLLLVATCSYFTPLLSTLVSCAYLKVVPGSKLWAGAALIVLGSLLSWRSVSAHQQSAA